MVYCCDDNEKTFIYMLVYRCKNVIIVCYHFRKTISRISIYINCCGSNNNENFKTIQQFFLTQKPNKYFYHFNLNIITNEKN